MSISYDNLWKLLSEKGMNKTELCTKAGISTNALAKLSKNESVHVEILSKICGALDCSFDEIVRNTGENSVISPLPDIDLSDYWVHSQLSTLGITSLADFPKPYTINNIKKTLTKFVIECKLSISVVHSILDELNKHEIHIVIDDDIVPEYKNVPKRFSFSEKLYDIEYQQAKNYLSWILQSDLNEEDSLLKELGNEASENVSFLHSAEYPSVKFDGLKITYSAPINDFNKDSQFPLNLFADILGIDIGRYYAYQHPRICDTANEMLSTLPPEEEQIIRLIYQHRISSKYILKQLNMSNNDVIARVFEDKYIRRTLRKLRQPRRSAPIKASISDNIKQEIAANELNWNWSDEYFDSSFLPDSIKADGLLSAYISGQTCAMSKLLLVETFYEDEISWHLLSIDAFQNVMTVETDSNNGKQTINSLREAVITMVNFVTTCPKCITVEEMDLSIRSFNCLMRGGICTLEELSQKTENDLMKIRNLGKNSLDEIICKMKSYGYYLNESGVFEYHGLDAKDIKIDDFARYYREAYSRNDNKHEEKLKLNFFDRCCALGFSLTSADWFIDIISKTSESLNNPKFVAQIDNAQVLGSIILKKWRHITHWTSDDLLSEENRTWFVFAFNHLYQLCCIDDDFE